MRALFSNSLPRLAVVAAIVATCSQMASAYDEETVSDNLQPYFGGWLGMYQTNTDDLARIVNGVDVAPNLDLFWPAAPAGGISLGVAYGRVHMGANLGYQMYNGGNISAADRAKYDLYSNYHYDVIPLDFNLDLAMLPNIYPVNFLIGGSIGIGFVRIENPFKSLGYNTFNDSGRIVSTTVEDKSNEFQTNSFLLATGFIGARINLARRLNLEGQIGWRSLSTDALEYNEGLNPRRIADMRYKGTSDTVIGYTLKPIPVDLSGAYARLDLRWTFASKAEKERAARMEERRKVLERIGTQVATKD